MNLPCRFRLSIPNEDVVLKQLSREEIEDMMRSPLARDFQIVGVRMVNPTGESDPEPDEVQIPDWAHRVLRERGAEFADFLRETIAINWETGGDLPVSELVRRNEDTEARARREVREAELLELRDAPIPGPDGIERDMGRDEAVWLNEYVSQALTFREPGSRARAMALCDEYYGDNGVFTLNRLINLMVDYGETVRLRETQALN